MYCLLNAYLVVVEKLRKVRLFKKWKRRKTEMRERLKGWRVAIYEWWWLRWRKAGRLVNNCGFWLENVFECSVQMRDRRIRLGKDQFLGLYESVLVSTSVYMCWCVSCTMFIRVWQYLCFWGKVEIILMIVRAMRELLPNVLRCRMRVTRSVWKWCWVWLLELKALPRVKNYRQAPKTWQAAGSRPATTRQFSCHTN